MVDLVGDRSFDLVQAMGAHHYHGPLLARMLDKPLVWQLHSTIMPAPGRRLVAPIIRRVADVIMVNGESVGRAFFGAHQPDDRFKVFYAPVKADQFRPEPAKRIEARQRLALPQDGIVVGTVGNRVWQKNHELLIEVARDMVDLYPAVRFVILGRENDAYAASYRKVMEAAEQLNAQRPGYVTITDPGLDVPLLLNALDIFVLTSHTKGVPITLFEASCTRIPTISTNVGSISDVIVDGETGFLCPPGSKAELVDRIRILANDADRRRVMGENARRRIETEFSLAQVEAVHIAAYEQALSARA